jgi:hypothetical protein
MTHQSPRKNFYLSMLSESDKTADHEMSTSDHGPFYCVRFASVRSVTTTLSGESGAAIWHRSDRDRKGFDSTSSCCNVHDVDPTAEGDPAAPTVVWRAQA